MTLGVGAEVVARIVEDCFDYLEAPVLRVTGFDTPYPPATIERTTSRRRADPGRRRRG